MATAAGALLARPRPLTAVSATGASALTRTSDRPHSSATLPVKAITAPRGCGIDGIAGKATDTLARDGT
jgi:hypothetical protein